MPIDNYLRTSLIFYDLAEKQDFRKKVLENIRIPRAQMVERYRLPPFNITSTILIGVPIIFGLYSKHTDIETADLLGGTYDGANLISLEFDGMNYWLVYDGETNLGEPMPLGEQYVRISDGFRTWESETIKISNCPNNVMDWHGKHIIEMIYNTFGRGEPREIIKPNGSFGPMVYYYNNKSYGSWEQRGGVGFSCEGMVYAIYHKECFISESYRVGPGTLNASDPHSVPVLLVADDGHIVVAHERLTGAPGTYPPDQHNGYMQIKRSDNEEDETSWVNAIAHFGDYFDEIGNEGAWRLSYPSLDKLANSKLFLFCRHSSAGELDRVSIHRSNDHGISWDDLGGDIDGGCDVVDLSPPATGSDLIYKGLCKHPYDNSLHLMVWWKDAPNNNFPDLYYLESHDDGVNFQDISGGFVQDITAGGNDPIMKVNLDAGGNDFLVKHCVNPETVTPIDGMITDAGIPYIVTFKANTGVYDLFMYYWNGAAWIETEMGFPDSGGCILFQRGDVIEIIVAELQNGTFKRNVYRSRTMTAMNDWTLIKEVYEDDNHILLRNRCAATFNYTIADYEAFAAMTNRIDGFYSDLHIFAESEDCNCCSGLSKAITIEYENIHDFAGILSQTGYKGRVHLCADIRKPDQKIIKLGKERDGENWIQKIITQKIYRFNIFCTEGLIDTLTMIPSYETIIVHIDNETSEVKEFNVAPPEWKYEGLGQLEISFIVETIIKTNCDTDYELQEELILNGDFSAWGGDDPDIWGVTEDADPDVSEISEVAPNEGHDGIGADACNIFSDGVLSEIFQTILTIGSYYVCELDITFIVAGAITFSGMAGAPVYNTIGRKTFIFLATGATFYISRSGACDVTIDNVSVKLYS